MKAKLLLRIASGAMLFHLLGHTFGHSGWKKTTDPVQQEVINQMTGHAFPFMGAVRSMADYYDGYGWASSVALVFFALVLWIVSGHLHESKSLTNKILIATIVCLCAWGILEFIYFFPFAASITLLAAALTVVALIQLRKQKV